MIRVETTGEDVGVIMENVRKGMRSGMERGILLAAEIAAGELRREIQTSFQQHTGMLGRSFRATLVSKDAKTVKAGALSDLHYARIQDRGGDIVPKNVRLLTVPLTDQAKRWSRAGGSARDLPNERGKKHWAFVKRVHLAGRRYISKAAVAARDEIAEQVGNEIAKGVEEQV